MMFDFFSDLPFFIPVLAGMITAKQGRPGSGKTHDAVKNDLIPALLSGRRVYCNIDGTQTKEAQTAWREIYGVTEDQLANFRFLDNAEIPYFWNLVEPGSLVILDEVQRHYDSKEYMSQANKDFGKWASTHRHFGIDVVLISQMIGRIEKSVRDLVDFTYAFTKIRGLGKAASRYYKCEFYSGSEVEGYPPLKTELRPYDRKIFPCYESYVNKVGEKFNIDKNVNLWKHPVFFAIPVALCLFLYFAFQSFSGNGIWGTVQRASKGEFMPDLSTQSQFLDNPVVPDVDLSFAVSPAVPDLDLDPVDLPGVSASLPEASGVDLPAPAAASPAPGSSQSEEKQGPVKIGELNGQPIYRHSNMRFSNDSI